MVQQGYVFRPGSFDIYLTVRMLQLVMQRLKVGKNLFGVLVRKEIDDNLIQRVRVIESNRLDRNKVSNVFERHAYLNHLLQEIPRINLKTVAEKSF